MKKIGIIILLIGIVTNYSYGQDGQKEDLMADHFFSPDLIMPNHKVIGLSQEQEKGIMTEMKSAQSDFMDLNWQMSKVKVDFTNLIGNIQVDETKTLEALSEMLTIENKIKKRQITLMIRIKNILSPEQQEKLNNLK